MRTADWFTKGNSYVTEYEFEVDAATGNFLDWEVEMD